MINPRAFTAWLRSQIRWIKLLWLMWRIHRTKPAVLDNFGIPASAVRQRIAELEGMDEYHTHAYYDRRRTAM